MNNTSCEYCGEALPLGVDKRTRRIRTAHFASCAMRPKRVEVEPPRRETEQEPVAWMYVGIKHDGTTHGPHLVWKPEHMDAMSAEKGVKAVPLYAALKGGRQSAPSPEQPEQEPVAWQWLNTAHFRKKLPADAEPREWNPLYTHPVRREPEPVVWVWSHQLEELNELGSHGSIRAWANTASHRFEGLIPLYTRCERQA